MNYGVLNIDILYQQKILVLIATIDDIAIDCVESYFPKPRS